MVEYATYGQVAYFKRCISAMKHKYKIDTDDAVRRCHATLPLSDMYRGQISKAIKQANQYLTGRTDGSVGEYWKAVKR